MKKATVPTGAADRSNRTLVLVKPDGVARGLVGEIIGRIERTGLRLAALRMVRANRKKIDGHYPKDRSWIERLGKKTIDAFKEAGLDRAQALGSKDPLRIGREVRSWLLKYMTSGPIVAMVFEGPHAVEIVRKLTGETIPLKAQPGTIRGDFSTDSALVAGREKRSVLNLLHASDTTEEATREIARWFQPGDFPKRTC